MFGFFADRSRPTYDVTLVDPSKHWPLLNDQDAVLTAVRAVPYLVRRGYKVVGTEAVIEKNETGNPKVVLTRQITLLRNIPDDHAPFIQALKKENYNHSYAVRGLGKRDSGRERTRDFSSLVAEAFDKVMDHAKVHEEVHGTRPDPQHIRLPEPSRGGPPS